MIRVDLLRLHLGERTAQNGEILGIYGHTTAVDLPEPRDHAVPGELLLCHPEVGDLMRGQAAQFLESSAINQGIEALARRQLALPVLFVDPRLAAAFLGAGAHFEQFFKFVFHVNAFGNGSCPCKTGML